MKNGIWKSILMIITATVTLSGVSTSVGAQATFFTLEPIVTEGDTKTTNFHDAHATDYLVPRGTTVYPIAIGKVVEVVTNGVPIGVGTKYTGENILKHDPGRGMGNYVIIEHEAPDGKKFYSTYAHMESVAVTKGMEIKKIDTPIGAVGDTGIFIGQNRMPHLHVQVDNVEPKINENNKKLFPVFPYDTDPRHGNKSTKELTENLQDFIERYKNKDSTAMAEYGTSRKKYNEYAKAQDKSAPPAIVASQKATTKPVSSSKDSSSDPKVVQLKETMKEKAVSAAKINVVPITVLPTAMNERINGVKISELPAKLPANLPQGKVASTPSDASKVAERIVQQLLTPTEVIFVQGFEGLFTQTPDAPGSRGANHSGTITDGIRVDVKGDSRAGDFTGSITNGRTVADPGYTAAPHNNAPFVGVSIGTASAKGFKEGVLKGDMTVIVPARAQTATVSGNITIQTNGSLSMPSYSGPILDNATGNQVGTMTGTWNQGATR